MNKILHSNNGIVTLPDGTVIYVVEIQFSHNGINFWEDKYNPMDHIYEEDGVTTIPGHKYMRLRKSGHTEFEKPMYITAVDGDHPVIRNNGTALQYKLSQEDDVNYQDIIQINELKGPEGPKGEDGKGLEIHKAGALDSRPACGSYTSYPNPCGGGTTEVCAATTFASLGNHKIVTEDISTATQDYYHIKGLDETGSITGWVKTESFHEGEYVMAWKSTTNDNTSGDALTVNKQGVVLNLDSYTGGTYSNSFDSTGVIFICSEETWVIAMNISSPDGFVRMNATDVLSYLEDKLDNVFVGTDINGKVTVVDNSINNSKLVFDWLGNGLEYHSDLVKPILGDGFNKDVNGHPVNNLFELNLNDLINHGLNLKVGTDGNNDLRVNTDDLNGFGLVSFQPAAADSGDKVLKVDSAQLVGYGLKADRAPLTDYIIDIDANSTQFEFDSGNGDQLTLRNQGITGSKLNPSIIGAGLEFVDSGSDGIPDLINVLPDGVYLGFDSSDQLTVKDASLTGDKLADNLLGSGIKYSTDSVRKLMLDIDTNRLEFSTDQLTIKESYITGLIPSNLFSLTDGVQTIDLSRGNSLTVVSNSGSIVNSSVAVNSSGSSLVFNFSHDEAALVSKIENTIDKSYTYNRIKEIFANTAPISFDDSTNTVTVSDLSSSLSPGSMVSALDGIASVGSQTDYARADHKHSIVDGSIDQTKINNLSSTLAEKIDLDTMYGSGNKRYILTGSGIKMVDSSGTERWLATDTYGNLYTETV